MWLRRISLYGTALLLLWGGNRYYETLELRAVRADVPYRTLTVFKGKLGRGRLRKGLEASGSGKEEIRAVLKALRKTGGTTAVRGGDAYRIVRSTEGAIHHLTLIRGKTKVVVTPSGKGFKAILSKQPLETISRTVSGSIDNSLWLSMNKIGASHELIQEFADVFQWAVDFLTEPRKGDHFAVTWNESRTPDGRIWAREIQAARYNGKKTGQKTGILFEKQYFNEKGEALRKIFLAAPLNFRRISSRFSTRRRHPILRKRRPHHGIDYAAPRGTPVVSVGSGRVTARGRRGGFGKRIEIRHTPVYSTLYGHLSRYAKGIKTGTRVRQGQLIGYVGSTGLATGPHLHFQVSKHGRWVNFLRLKLPTTKTISVKNKKAFFILRDRYVRLLDGKGPTPLGTSGR